jgi:5-methyltetrahydropteroyltriglutamate--homocysteine methyltransferase
MQIPTEPIGSIPRPIELILGMQAHAQGQMDEKGLQELYESALIDTIRKFELTGSPVITDGEQTKPSFATYPIAGMKNLRPQGVVIPFADGHSRQLPTISEGPFHYMNHAAAYLKKAKQYTRLPVKQAVISVSALSLRKACLVIPRNVSLKTSSTKLKQIFVSALKLEHIMSRSISRKLAYLSS